MRVATYNIRNVRAVDRRSLWWRRRARLAGAVAALDADLVGMQEAYAAQISWLRRHALPGPLWEVVGEGRNARGGGEAVPVWHRRAALAAVAHRTRWFGPTPDVSGSRNAGAQFPRIATIAEYEIIGADGGAGARLVVANVHLDSSSAAHRATSIRQLVEWIAPLDRAQPTIVMGDFNAPTSEPGFAALTDAGLRSVLGDDAGPTANGFGRSGDRHEQIDHIFVTDHFDVSRAEIVTTAGFASDHYPVVADLDFRGLTAPGARG